LSSRPGTESALAEPPDVASTMYSPFLWVIPLASAILPDPSMVQVRVSPSSLKVNLAFL
jgi:hypothetical protein